MSERDGKGNSIRGRGVVMNASNVHVRSDEHLTTVVGVDDVIVVTTQDAVLVLNKTQGDSVKQLVDLLKTENRPEALEHKRSYRPWGYYQSVDSGARYQVKRIVVKPGERLSLQKHLHRAEHWVVVKGTAEVTRDNEVHLVHGALKQRLRHSVPTLFFQPHILSELRGVACGSLSYRNRRLGDAVAIPIGRRCVCRGRRHQYGDRESNGSARVGRHRQTSASFPNSGGRPSRL